jgi:hypothetical protein
MARSFTFCVIASTCVVVYVELIVRAAVGAGPPEPLSQPAWLASASNMTRASSIRLRRVVPIPAAHSSGSANAAGDQRVKSF